jgi:hypothetical protein
MTLSKVVNVFTKVWLFIICWVVCGYLIHYVKSMYNVGNFKEMIVPLIVIIISLFSGTYQHFKNWY